MGQNKSKDIKRSDLSQELKAKIDDIFKIFDKDQSGTIEKEEAVKHWNKGFGKISA